MYKLRITVLAAVLVIISTLVLAGERPMYELNKVTKIWECRGFIATFKADVIHFNINNPSLVITKDNITVHEHKNFDGWNTKTMDYRSFKVFEAFLSLQ